MGFFDAAKEGKLRDRLNGGDPEALGSFYDQYARAIWRQIFFRVGHEEVAQDLASQTFLKLWEYIRNGQRVEFVRSFLYRTANNLVIDYFRSKARTDVLIDDELGSTLGDSGTHAAKMGGILDLELVRKMVTQLPDDARQLIIWRYIDDLSIGEIAELIGKTRNAVSISLHRAIKVLRERAKETYGDQGR